MRLRISPGRSIVGIDEFAVEPLCARMRPSERFLEIAHLRALLHYARTIEHVPGNHPVRAIPSQNPLQFLTGLMPELADRRSDRGGWASEHRRVLTHVPQHRTHVSDVPRLHTTEVCRLGWSAGCQS